MIWLKGKGKMCFSNPGHALMMRFRAAGLTLTVAQAKFAHWLEYRLRFFQNSLHKNYFSCSQRNLVMHARMYSLSVLT